MSYVNETGGRSRKNRNKRTPNRESEVQPSRRQEYQPDNNNINERVIQSADIDRFKEAEEGNISEALERTIRLNWISTLLIVCVLLTGIHKALILLPIVGVVLKIIAHTSGRVNLEYSFDAEKEDEHNRRIGAWQLLAEGEKEWQVLTEQFNSNKKVNAGANRSLKRVECKIQKGRPFYIDTNVETIEIKLNNKELLIILPDKVFFVRKGKVGTIDYSDFRISVSSVRFVETGSVPRDAQVVGQTWQYVNKNGTPDQRYKNNKQIPICLYGQVFLRSSTGLNVELQISNNQNTRDFAELIN